MQTLTKFIDSIIHIRAVNDLYQDIGSHKPDLVIDLTTEYSSDVNTLANIHNGEYIWLPVVSSHLCINGIYAMVKRLEGIVDSDARVIIISTFPDTKEYIKALMAMSMYGISFFNLNEEQQRILHCYYEPEEIRNIEEFLC
jgi:hypothetical protein